MYSHTKTPLRKIIHLLTYTDEVRIKEQKSLLAFKEQFGYEPTVDYKKKETGYWQFVKTVFLVCIVPYSLSFFRLYYLWPEKVPRRNK